ncbi:MAG: Transcriptional regulatory protein DegU [Elusimicrobia bacterium]|nr:Transcriptional regulatory protein DegU [Elusimicrobiota bacterium]
MGNVNYARTSDEQEKLRLFIVDDNPVVREVMTKTLNQEKDFLVVESVGSGREAWRRVFVSKPDMVIIDLNLPDVKGIDLIRDIKAREVRLPIIAFSFHEDEAYAEKVLWAGAQGYVMKENSIREIANAIRAVARGETYLSRNMLNRFQMNHPGGLRHVQYKTT